MAVNGIRPLTVSGLASIYLGTLNSWNLRIVSYALPSAGDANGDGLIDGNDISGFPKACVNSLPAAA